MTTIETGFEQETIAQAAIVVAVVEDIANMMSEVESAADVELVRDVAVQAARESLEGLRLYYLESDTEPATESATSSAPEDEIATVDDLEESSREADKVYERFFPEADESKPGSVDDTDDKLMYEATRFINEIYGVGVTGTLFGGVSIDGGRIRFDDNLEIGESVLACTALYSLLCKAYLAGRADQIADIEADNSPRAVRARGLKKVINASAFVGTQEECEERRAAGPETLDMLNSYRGILRPQVIGIALSDAERTEALNAFIGDDEVMVLFERKNGLKRLQREFWSQGLVDEESIKE